MRKLFSLLAVSAGLFLVSCKKENISNPNPEPLLVKKKMTKTDLNEDRSFIYNADGTIKEIHLDNMGYEYKETYTYTPNKISYAVMNNGIKTATGEYFLANGKVTKFIEASLDNNGSIDNMYEYNYTYNEKGLMKKKVYQNGYYVIYTYDDKDNLVKLVEYNPQDQASEVTEFVYGNQKDLFPQYGYLNSTNSGFVFPAYAKFLPVARKVTYAVTGETIAEGTFSYVLDADGYVVKGKYTKLAVGTNSFEWNSTFQ